MNHKSIWYALLLCLFILPGYRYLIQGLNGLYLAAAFICFGSWAGWLMPYSLVMEGGGYPTIKLPRYAWAYLVFIGSGILSVIFSSWPQGSHVELMLWGICIIIFVAVINLPIDHKDHLLNGLLLTGLIFNITKLYQVGLLLLGINQQAQGRLMQPNNTAGFVNLIIIISLAIMIQDKNRAQKFWAFFGLESSLIILWYTGSRGGIIAGMVGIAVVLFISWLDDPGVYKYPRLVVLWDIVGSSLFIYTSFLNRAAAIITDAANTTAYRFEVWQLGLDLFNKYKLLGAGPNTFYYHALLRIPAANPVKWIHPHNLYIQILAELGLVGLFTGSTLLIIIICSLFSDSMVPKFKAIGLAVVAITLTHGLVDLPWYEPSVLRPMVILMALALYPSGPSCHYEC